MVSYAWGCGSGYHKFWQVNCNFLAQRREICSYSMCHHRRFMSSVSTCDICDL